MASRPAALIVGLTSRAFLTVKQFDAARFYSMWRWPEKDCAANEKDTDNKAKQGVYQLLDYCELSNRFPRDQWDSALQFFLKKQEE